jgi:hypothetical protein
MAWRELQRTCQRLKREEVVAFLSILTLKVVKENEDAITQMMLAM